MSDNPLLLERDGPLARLILNRPSLHNAFDEHLIDALTRALDEVADDATIRVVLLTGAGKSFSAGADLDWMRRVADYDDAANRADARRLEDMLRTLDELPKPTIALVNGAAIGGGVGLVAACDIALAADHAVFALAEVRLGLLPAVISPFVIRAMGERACRRYFLTGERFAAATAQRLGLVHEIAPAAELETAAAPLIQALLDGAPGAITAAKHLLPLNRDLKGSLLAEATVAAIAERRASPEGREGVAAFLGKRRPGW